MSDAIRALDTIELMVHTLWLLAAVNRLSETFAVPERAS